MQKFSRLVAHTVRGIAIDAVQKAASGHPGMPLGAADLAAVLFLDYLKHHPSCPAWLDRDRYVQSAGHGSMLLYALLHLCGYDLPLEELKNFRQWSSRTPGHPEHGLTPGVETTTGPLGQGCANAVGMALAEAMLAARFNRPGFPIVDHRTWVLAGDGDLMEGISHEAFSLAGHLGLHKLTVLYDYNRVTIEGRLDLACSDDVRRRFEGYGWNVLETDGHDPEQIAGALQAARRETKRPTLIIAHTHIGWGSPRFQDSAECHGAPLGEDEVRATKRALGLPEDLDFYVPPEVSEIFARRRAAWAAEYERWHAMMEAYRKNFPQDAEEFDRFFQEPPTAAWKLDEVPVDTSKPMATRQASGAVLQWLAERIPNLVGGSADLAPSTNTFLKKYDSVQAGRWTGRNLHFGVREHAMAAILNGMALHGGWIVYCSTFLVFSDYMKPAIRLAAMCGLPVVFVFTHDSFLIGEDGPTHQPVEQLPALRATPNLVVIRPADAAETVAAWLVALKRRNGPTALILTRQTVPPVPRTAGWGPEALAQGAYPIWQSADGLPDVILIATGSEVMLAWEAGRRVAEQGHRVRVVSMPSWELFDQQPAEWRHRVLPPECRRRVAIEAAQPLGWERYVGSDGLLIGMRRFGASAPSSVLAERFGFTPSSVAAAVLDYLCSRSSR